MSRDTRTRRLTPASRATSGASQAASQTTDVQPLISLVARTSRLVDLLPRLHQQALDATGGSCSLLFEFNPRNGVLQETSGFGLDELCTDAWSPAPAEHALVNDAFSRRTPTLVPDLARQMPDLAARLGVPAGLLIPLAQGPVRFGLLAIGFLAAPTAGRSPVRDDVLQVADAFLASMEIFRLRQKEELQRDLRELLDEFGNTLSATLNLPTGLEVFCLGANRLFGADRTSIWIHDRRGRHLVLRASSDPEHVLRGSRVSVDDALAPAAAAMRRARAELAPSGGDLPTSTVTVPLRGCRRALGTIVFEGVRVETGGELDLLDRADELGRQLSSAVENMQLLEDVRQSHRDLENAFDSISHLVVVCRRSGTDRPCQRSVREQAQAHPRAVARQAGFRMHRPGARRLAGGAGAIARAERRRNSRDVRGRGSGAEWTLHGHRDRSPQSGKAESRDGARRPGHDARRPSSKPSAKRSVTASRNRRSSSRWDSSWPASRMN